MKQTQVLINMIFHVGQEQLMARSSTITEVFPVQTTLSWVQHPRITRNTNAIQGHEM